MANIQSQIKRNRQNLVARERNKAVRSRTRNAVRKLETAIADGDQEAAQAQFPDATRALDRAATKGVMHKNAAARKKSRLAKHLDAMAG